MPRHGGGLVQRGQGDRVGGRGGQGEVTCPQLGFGDQVGQTPVYLPSLPRLGIGVDAPGEQRVVEPHPVPDHGDHPRPLAALQQLDGALDARPHGRGDHLDGRVGRAGGHQQDGADLVAQRTDPQAHQLGQRRGEFGVAAQGLVAERASEFECIERVSARDVGDAYHRRPGKGPAESLGDDLVQAAQGERVKLHPLDPVDAVEMQPCGRGVPGVGIGAMGEQQRRAPPHTARHESDDRLAGGIEPLQVVDRDQDRRALLERVDDRQHRRGQHL